MLWSMLVVLLPNVILALELLKLVKRLLYLRVWEKVCAVSGRLSTTSL